MSEEVRVPIERIDEFGVITPGTARLQNATLDDYRSLRGAPLTLGPGGQFVIVLKYTEEISD